MTKCNHDWESIYGGFSHERGYWNYSKCKTCGCETESYSHNDFAERAEAEEKCDLLDCCDDDE